MILQAFFGSAQTSLGYTFYDSAGDAIGSRVTTGIASGLAAGHYLVDATIPIGATGVFWDSAETIEGINEDLATYMLAETLRTNQVIINEGVKKASNLIPHNTDVN